jgi:hypothetical protein
MKQYTYTEMKDTRSGFGDALTELGKNKSRCRSPHSRFDRFT